MTTDPQFRGSLITHPELDMTHLKALCRFACATLAGGISLLVISAASAQPMTIEQGRAVVAPFYRALNAGNDAIALINQATAADWVSCSGNDECKPRDMVAPGIAGFHKAIPDLRWEIKELLVVGDRVIVRGEASGTPAGAFMGVPHGGRSFRTMSIDIHTVRDGKLVRAYHVEDWAGALRQLTAR